MGQQQLLLLVLGIVIVGLAVVAGINAFDENQRKSAEDAITNEGFRLASQAKAWYGKPTQYDGGGNDPSALGGITWNNLGVEDNSVSDGSAADAAGDYETPWGTVSMTADGTAGTITFDLQVSGDAEPFGTVTFDPSQDDEIQFGDYVSTTT